MADGALSEAVYAPQVRLRIQTDGSEERIDVSDRLVGFTFEDSDDRTDKASIQLDNWDLRFFESPLVMQGAFLEVSWGNGVSMSPPRRMIIKKVKGFATLQIDAHDRSVLLNNEQRCRVFESVTRSDVAHQVAEENGFTGTFVGIEDTEEVFECINQLGETDARLMRRLARREGFRFFIDETGFHWHSRRFGQAPTRCYRYFTDPQHGQLLVPQFEKNLFAKPGRVRVRGRDPMTRQEIDVSGSDEETPRETLGEVMEVVDERTGALTTVDRNNATMSVRNSSASTPGRAQREANARFRNSTRTTVKMKFPALGDPQQLSKSIVAIEGITEFLAGNYYVETVVHKVVPPPYVMTMKCVRDGTGRLARRVERERRSAGQPNRQAARPREELVEEERVDPRTGALMGRSYVRRR